MEYQLALVEERLTEARDRLERWQAEARWFRGDDVGHEEKQAVDQDRSGNTPDRGTHRRPRAGPHAPDPSCRRTGAEELRWQAPHRTPARTRRVCHRSSTTVAPVTTSSPIGWMPDWPISTERGTHAEDAGEPTSRTRLRSIGKSFDRNRVDALLTAPDALDASDRLDLKTLSATGVTALKDLNVDMLVALGWTPDRSEPIILTSGEHEITVPIVLRCETPSGLLLLAVDAVFGTDPAAVVAGKTAPAGTLLDRVRVAGKPEGRTVNKAAQVIFTADDPPSYLLVCTGGATRPAGPGPVGRRGLPRGQPR